MAVTQVVWVTRQLTTPRHIRGLLEALDNVEALDYAEIRIMTVGEEQNEHGVEIPAAALDSIIGQPIRSGQRLLITADNLPPQGLIWAANDDPA